MKKRFLALGLALSMIFSLSACGKAEDLDDMTDSTSAGSEDNEVAVSEVVESDSDSDSEEEPAKAEIPDYDYKMALVNETHSEDEIYKTDIWFVIEAPDYFSYEGYCVVNKTTGEEYPIYSEDYNCDIFCGKICIKEHIESYDQPIVKKDRAEIYTIRFRSKKMIKAEDLSVKLAVDYFDFDNTYTSVEGCLYNLEVNADLDDINTRQRYVHAPNLLKLSDDVYVVFEPGSSGGSVGRCCEFEGKYRSEDAVYNANSHGWYIVRGSVEQARDLIENNSTLWYVDKSEGEEKYMTEAECPKDLDFFITADEEEYMFGYVDWTGKMDRYSIDLEPLIGANIKYTTPDGYEIIFAY